MQKKYWISGLLALAIGAGAVGVAGAKQRALNAFGFGTPSFEEMDTNSDGMLTPDEMEGWKDLRFKRADANNDGMLSAEEMSEQAKMTSYKIVKRIIEHKDSNGDGMLSAEELATGHKGKAAMGKRIFAHLDTDGDGAISPEEFVARKGMWGKRRMQGKHRGNYSAVTE